MSIDVADLARLRLDVAADRPIDTTRLDGLARQAVQLAVRHGAPLDPVLDAVTEAVRADRRVADEIRAAVAPVRSVAVALAVMPLVLVPVLSRLVDLDLAGFYASPGGVVVGGVVGMLWAVGLVGVIGVVRSAGRPAGAGGGRAVVVGAGLAVVVHPLVGLAVGAVLWRRRSPPAVVGLAAAVELTAIATSAGLPLGAGLREAAVLAPDPVRQRLRHVAMQIDLGRPVRPASDDLGRLEALVDDLARSGGAPTPALRLTAAHLRAEELALARVRAGRLPARLTVPTVLGLLPATVLAVGAPLVAAGLAPLT